MKNAETTRESNSTRLMGGLSEMFECTSVMEDKLRDAVARFDIGCLSSPPPSGKPEMTSPDATGLFPEAQRIIYRTRKRQDEVHRLINILLEML